MPELKLSKLPDRTPIKLSINILPELNQALTAYAEAYEATYGRREPLTELIPAMLAAFLGADRSFQKQRRLREDV